MVEEFTVNPVAMDVMSAAVQGAILAVFVDAIIVNIAEFSVGRVVMDAIIALWIGQRLSAFLMTTDWGQYSETWLGRTVSIILTRGLNNSH